MVSYAQNREDVLLDRLFPRGKPGFYVDIGANDPVKGSVTKHFYELGWHGVNVEPASHPFGMLSKARERDVNLNVGISDTEAEMTLFELPFDFSGGSTFSEGNASRHRETGIPSVERKVPTMTLAQLCERHVPGEIDFLSIDVEGHELQVLEGGDWKRWRPRVVVIEATEPNTPIPTHQQWEHVLLDAGYIFATYDGLNRYYVRSEDADLAPSLAVPVNVRDAYIPYEHLSLVQDLKCALDDHVARLGDAVRRETAARLANQSILASFRDLASEVGMLRASYERLERGLTNARRTCESLRNQLVVSDWTVEQVVAEASRAREEARLMAASDPDAAAAIAGVSPASLGVARRLTAMSSQYPKAASSVKTALRTALKWKRAVANR